MLFKDTSTTKDILAMKSPQLQSKQAV